MSISPLNPSTVRRLGSSQVLISSVSVVKELVENSLDAAASSVEVRIHRNTLDLIEVRDNGHGIPPADHALVARRNCTSKLTEYADLQNVGSRNLGFRGEALASLAESSEEMSVVTRVDGEVTAMELKFGKDGELEISKPASHPVGTTVKVRGFLSTFPVRKQNALKASSKALGEMRRLLQAYALARPTLRYSLRVLKTQGESDWVYAPTEGAGIRAACLKVVGKDCVSMCEFVGVEHDELRIEAYLPKATADPREVSGIGQYISIDKRPLSRSIGTSKLVADRFKKKLKIALKNSDGLKDPFLWMNVACRPGAYDPNVEPGKDDVLFEDQAAFLRAIDKLFTQFYTTENPTVQRPVTNDNHTTYQGVVEQLASDPSDTYQALEQHTPLSSVRNSSFLSNMYDNQVVLDFTSLDETNVSENTTTPGDEENENEELNAIALSNPWTIAKMNGKTKTGIYLPVNSPQHSTSHKPNVMSSSTPNHSSPLGAPHYRKVGGLPTPQLSSSSPRSQHGSDLEIYNSLRSSELDSTMSMRPETIVLDDQGALTSPRSFRLGGRKERRSYPTLDFCPSSQVAVYSEEDTRLLPQAASNIQRQSKRQRIANRQPVPHTPSAVNDIGSVRSVQIPRSPISHVTHRRTRIGDVDHVGPVMGNLPVSQIPPWQPRTVNRDFGLETLLTRGLDQAMNNSTRGIVGKLDEINKGTHRTQQDSTMQGDAFLPIDLNRVPSQLRRSKSSKAGLGRDLEFLQLQRLTVVCRTSPSRIAANCEKSKESMENIIWGTPVDDAYDITFAPDDENSLKRWTWRLRAALKENGTAQEVIESVEESMRATFFPSN